MYDTYEDCTKVLFNAQFYFKNIFQPIWIKLLYSRKKFTNFVWDGLYDVAPTLGFSIRKLKVYLLQNRIFTHHIICSMMLHTLLK